MKNSRTADSAPCGPGSNHGDMPLMRVVAGIRPRGTRGGGRQFDWVASVIPPGAQPLIDGVEIPPEMLDGVHESVA